MQVNPQFIRASILVFLLLAFLLVQGYLYLGNELPESLRLTGANAVLMLVPIFTAYAAFRYYQPPEKVWILALLLASLAGACMAWLALTWAQMFSPDAFALTVAFNSLILPALSYAGLLEGKYRRTLAMKQHMQRIDQLSREAELNKFKQQLQPHFLFNSLNSISALVVKKPKEAREMTEKLATFFRATLELQNQTESQLHAELEVIKKYLAIEEIRFAHRLKIAWDISENALAAKIPPLLLQPLVENAIKFGLYGNSDQITLTFKALLKGNHLEFSVCNPYREEVHLPGTGHGLKMIKERLYSRYLRHDLLRTSIEDKTFIATLILPQ